MATIDPQRQIFTLIRDFASEKSHGERRIAGLKKQIGELRIELDTANAELEDAKTLKESTEQELKGYEVECSVNVASVQALEARISRIQDEIYSVGSEVERLKSEEDALRDKFIGQMVEYNTDIREFQAKNTGKFQKQRSTGTTAGADHKFINKLVTEVDTTTLEDMLTEVAKQTAKEEQEYLAEQDIQKKLQQEYVDLQRKVCVMEVIMKESKALEDLIRQNSQLEQKFASLGEELVKRCTCPSCQANNVEALGGILQASDAN